MKSQTAMLKFCSSSAIFFSGLMFYSIFATIVFAAEEDVEQTASSKIFELSFDDQSNHDRLADESDQVVEYLPSEGVIAPAKDNRTTSEKLEDLKQEVLTVNRDLFILEEDLLFPASTQLAAYFSVDIGYFFSLDNIKIKIDDKQVAHHLYTEKDISALYRGAIQKVYMGNINSGEHEIVAILIGKGPHNRNYRIAVSFKFVKTSEAKALEIQLRDDGAKLQSKLTVVEW